MFTPAPWRSDDVGPPLNFRYYLPRMTRIEAQGTAVFCPRNTRTTRKEIRIPCVPWAVLFLGMLCSAPAAETVNLAERNLKKIVEQQQAIFAEAVKQGDKMDEGSFRQQVQSVVHDYELLLRNNPQFAAGYAAYGYLLTRIDQRKEAMAILLKANQLDPDIAMVKNQLGNLIAE